MAQLVEIQDFHNKPEEAMQGSCDKNCQSVARPWKKNNKPIRISKRYDYFNIQNENGNFNIFLFY